MLAGEPPFTGSSAQAIIVKRFSSEAPRVSLLRTTVPEVVDQVVIKALARAPADRHPSAADFCRALAIAPVISSPNTSTGPSKRPAAGRLMKSTRNARLAAGTLGFGLLIGAGALFAWLRTGPPADATGPKRLAVLPFENLGRPEDEYFTDGITDEVRGKLAGLPGLQVIARSSSVQYKKAAKSPRQIGEELGAQYFSPARCDGRRAGRVRAACG